jgi:transposase
MGCAFMAKVIYQFLTAKSTFCDLRKHKIFDVAPGKSAKGLEAFLLTLEGREKVRVVCMDLSPSSIVYSCINTKRSAKYACSFLHSSTLSTNYVEK